MKSTFWLLSSLATALLLAGASCSSGKSNGSPGSGNSSGDDGGDGGGNGLNGDGGNDDGGVGPLPFSEDPPAVYVAKVKNILVGLPPTDGEVQAVESDPTKLGALVDTWMTSTSACAPSASTCVDLYQRKMLRFFELAFQQTQIAEQDFDNMLNHGPLGLDGNRTTQPLMVQNQQEVFARTMLAIASSGQPFNQAMTTQSYMMTTAMKVFYALTDVWQLDNTIGGTKDHFATQFPAKYPGVDIQVTAKTAVPLSDTVNPASKNFMVWYDPALTGCDPVVYAPQADKLFQVLEGTYVKDKNGCTTAKGQGQLVSTGGAGGSGDFSDWTMVALSQPQGGQATTDFWNLPALRSASQMVLNRPYVGYFTTPAFFANWPTNASNQMRVTTNQTLIVATGTAISVSDQTVPPVNPPPGLDPTHATQPECIACHTLLDPTRSIFTSTFSFYYGQQIDSPPKDNPPGGLWSTQKGMFVFGGVTGSPKSIYDFGQILSTHPLVAPAWVQKLCFYMDSQACTPSDPEFQRIATLFQGQSYSWNTLVKALVTSPLTTHTVSTLTATTNGEPVAVSRRDHLCAALNARLGFADICNLDAAKAPLLSKNALAIVPGMPSDGYGRGTTDPVLPNDPSIFYRAGMENFCEAIAQLVVDPTTHPNGVASWRSSDCTSTKCQPITDFVSVVAGIPPSDPRAKPLHDALVWNFQQSQSDGGASATSALQSTFMLACMTPSAMSLGL